MNIVLRLKCFILLFRRKINSLTHKLKKIIEGDLSNSKVEIDLLYELAGTPGYAQYAFIRENLPSGGGVVYSLGVGEDTSFDKELIERYGVELHAFDFTPRSITYLEKNPVSGMTFHPYGVAAKDGSLTFYAPYQEKNVSWSNVPRDTRSETFPVKRLSTIMRELGHTHLDILKMDIEGAEYEVLEDMLLSGIRPNQLLVEFQHRFEGVGILRTKRILGKLKKEGYKIFFISDSREEFSFIRANSLNAEEMI